MRLRTVIFGVYVFSSAAGFALLMAIMLWEVRPRYMESTRKTMAETAHLLAVMLEAKLEQDQGVALPGRVEELCRRELAALQRASGRLRVYVTNRDGLVIGDSDGGRDLGRDYTRRAEMASYFKGLDDYEGTTDLVEGELRVSAPVRHEGRIVALVGVGRALSSVQQLIRSARIRLSVEAMAVAALMLVAGWLVASRVSVSIEKLTHYAREARTRAEVRPPVSMALEIQELGRAFEELRQALEGKQYVETYTQTLAHELKAPLSALRGAAEILAENPPEEDRRRFLANLRSETERLRQIVDRMLALASVEARRGRHEQEPVPLGGLCRELVSSLESAGILRGRGLVLDLDGDPVIRGERFLLRQALENLLQNALDFSPSEGRVRLVLRRETPDKAVLLVEDEGPGIPSYARERVFERFYSLPRPGTGRKSTGLGLSFVREVARLHGGEVSLSNRPEGGARAELRLPLS